MNKTKNQEEIECDQKKIEELSLLLEKNPEDKKLKMDIAILKSKIDFLKNKK